MLRGLWRTLVQLPILVAIVLHARWTAYDYPKCTPLQLADGTLMSLGCPTNGAGMWAGVMIFSLVLLVAGAVIDAMAEGA